MSRTTLNIDTPILEELRKIQKRERKSLGRIVSDLLVRALADEQCIDDEKPFPWHVQQGAPLVDIEDKDALRAILDETGE